MHYESEKKYANILKTHISAYYWKIGPIYLMTFHILILWFMVLNKIHFFKYPFAWIKEIVSQHLFCSFVNFKCHIRWNHRNARNEECQDCCFNGVVPCYFYCKRVPSQSFRWLIFRNMITDTPFSIAVWQPWKPWQVERIKKFCWIINCFVFIYNSVHRLLCDCLALNARLNNIVKFVDVFVLGHKNS